MYVKYSKFPKWIQKVLMGVMWPHHDWRSAEVSLSPNLLSRRLLKVDNIMCDILHHIGILLTFGLCCPVLAFTIVVYVSIYVLVLLVVFGRFLTLIDCGHSNVITIKSDNGSTLLAALELASINSDVYVSTCMWEVVWMSSLFYALLCWDMATDQIYWKKAVWIPVTAMALPVVMLIFHVMLSKYYFRTNIQNIDIKSTLSLGSESSDRHSRWHHVHSKHQVSGEIGFQRLTFSQASIAKNDVINEDKIDSDCKRNNEVTSPLAIPTKV